MLFLIPSYDSVTAYLKDDTTQHPYYTATLVIAIPSLIVAVLSALYVKRQADEAKRMRQQGETALGIAQTAAAAAEVQAHTAQRALGLTRLQSLDSQRAATAAADSAEASRQSAETAKTSMEIGSRAWLTVAGVQVQLNLVKLPEAIRVVLRNSGVTPASDIHYRQVTAVVDDPPATIDFDIPEAPTNVHPPIGNGGELLIDSLNVPLHGNEPQRVLEGELHIVLLGTVKYRDVFGYQRQVTWYYRFSPRSGQFIPVSHLNTAS